MDIKISCIIPYYNIERELLFQCVDSILRQDFKEFEILIVDDGSDQIFVSYLKEVCHLDNRIRVLHQSKRGVSSARNLGLLHAQGEYISFVDADDMVVPSFFSEAYRIALDNNAEYVAGCVVGSRLRDQDISCVSSPRIERVASESFKTSLIIVTDNIPEGGYFGRGPIAKLIKREILNGVFFPENVILGEDIIWNLDVISKCKKIYKVYQVWYLYWTNPNSASNRYHADAINLCEQHLTELVKRLDLKDEKEAEAYFLHVFEILRRHIYDCYLGRKECPLPFFKRYQTFCQLYKKEPWNLYQTGFVSKHCNRKTRTKYFLLKSGLYYWYCFMRDHIRRSSHK